MNPESATSALVAACAKETSAYIFNYAQQAGLDQPSFLISVAAVLAASALAAQPQDQLQEAAAHIRHAIGLVHCIDDEEH